MANSTLAAIQTKVRRITRSPSEAQLSTDQINEYINTFVLYDMPERLRLFALKTTLTFYTEPFIDTYETNTTDPTNPLYQFKDRYITVHDPIYIAGYPSFFTQSRSQFFGIYPMVSNIASIGTSGDGSTTAFSGTLANVPILRNNVLFESVTTANTGVKLIDDGLGALTGDGTGTINYVTGAFTLNFTTAPAVGQAINSQTVPYVASLPQSLLFYDEKFTLRPVPDQVYAVNMEVYIRPTELLDDDQSPNLQEWWQYIAYGAIKKVFEDRVDMESVAKIMPEFQKQERLIESRTLVQQTNTRTATIYTEQTSIGASNGFWGWFGSNF